MRDHKYITKEGFSKQFKCVII